MRKFYLLMLLGLLVAVVGRGQNAIVGTGFSYSWNSDCQDDTHFVNFSASVGGTYILAAQPYGHFTGDRYFRLAVDWGGTVQQRATTSNTDQLLTIGQKYQLIPQCNQSGTMYINATDGFDYYIFKTLNAGTNPNGDFVVFKVQGDVRSVTSISQSPTSVEVGDNVTVTATLNGEFSTGQSAYLRYTYDSWTTSTVVEMSGAGTTQTATIPSMVNGYGNTIEYYVFTSGSGLTIPGEDADLFTINYQTNGGNNYSYSFPSNLDVFDDFNRANSDTVGIPSSGGEVTWAEHESVSSGTRINGSAVWFESILSDQREAISFDMSGYYPVAFDESTEDMRWAWNMRSTRTNPSGFTTNNYGSAFILGSNKSNFDATDAYGYAVILGESGSNDSLRLVWFENGLKSSINIHSIAAIKLSNNDVYLSINVTYNACTNGWTLDVREEADLGFTNPSIGAFPLSASGTDETFTATELPWLGAFWKHNTSGSESMKVDNIYIPKASIASENVYTWSGDTSGNFNTPANWNPERTCPRNRDVLIFNGGAVNVSEVPNQTIGQFIVQDNASITLGNQTSQHSDTLKLTGGPGIDFRVESGSTLNLDSKNASYGGEGIVFSLKTNTTGEVAGTLQFDNSHNSDGRDHMLLVKDTDALHIKNGGRVEALTLLQSNNPFGDTGGLNAVIFESGSTYLHASGANPFGYARPDSKVVFEPGSWYEFTSSGTPSMSGRTYANFKYDVNANKSLPGSYDYFMDTLVINQGTLEFNLDATGTIAGDIEVASGANLTFNPSSGGVINVNAPAVQNIFGTGSMTIGQHATLNLQNQNRINIQKNITVNGTANVVANAVVDFDGENHFSGSGTTTFQDNATVYLGSSSGISASGSTGNVQTASRSYSGQVAYIYDGHANQVTGNGLPPTLSGFGKLEIANTGAATDNTVTLSHSGTSTTPLLTLTNGRFSVGTNDTLAISNNGSVVSTAGNFAPGSLAGTIAFLGTGTVNASGDLDFWNVTLPVGSGNLDFGANGTGTIHHEMVINNNRNIDPNGPYYADNSTLVYNTGGDFTAGADWYANFTSGRGIPYDVQIGRQGVNNTKLNFGSSNAWRYCRGSVNIGDAGGGSGYGFYLSDSYGGDLKLDGDFVVQSNGDFGANERAVFFVGSSHQTITSHLVNDTIRFDYLIIDKASGDVLLDDNPGTPINVEGASGGAVLVLSGGDLDLRGQTFNLGGSSPDLKLEGDGTVDRVVKSDSPAAFNIRGDKKVVSQNGTRLLFNNQVVVNISAGMDFGSDLTTINATLQINPGGYANLNAPRYGPQGVLKYNTGGEYLRRVEWSGTDGNAGYPNDVIVAGSTILKASGDGDGAVNTEFGARQDVTIESGSTIDMGNMAVSLVVGRDLTIEGELIASNVGNGDIHVAGDWLRTSGGTFTPKDRQVLFNGSTPQTITAAGGETFDYLAFDSAGTKTLNDDITVNKNLLFKNLSGSVEAGTRTITLKGNWINNGLSDVFNEATSKVIFAGNSVQTLTTTGSYEEFYDVSMNNSDGGLELAKAIRIKGNLNLTDGLIHTNTYSVEFENNATNSGGLPESYINGRAVKEGFTVDEEFKFPVGEYDVSDTENLIDIYQPAALIPQGTSTTAKFEVSYHHKNYFPGTFDDSNLPPMVQPLEKVSTCNYWIINRNSGSIDARIKLFWDNICYTINDAADLVVARANGDHWSTAGSYAVNSSSPYSSGDVTSGIVSAFSPFTIGSVSAINVLPIQLLTFNASAKDRTVETTWRTATETNNDYFTVERSVDAIYFEEVGRVAGAGNSTSERSYAYTDDAPYAGISYYRLRQTDFDGNFTYSPIRSVQIASDSDFELLQVYRSANDLRLTYRSQTAQLQVEVFDLIGKRLFHTSIANQTGSATLQPSLARGIYLLRLSNGTESRVMKFFY